MRRRIGNRVARVVRDRDYGPGAAPFGSQALDAPAPAQRLEGDPQLSRDLPVDRRGHQAVGRAQRGGPRVSAPGWRAFFDALKGELANYGTAVTSERARLLSLGSAPQDGPGPLDRRLGARPSKVRSALDEWLTPRVRVAWAERRLVEFVGAHKVRLPRLHRAFAKLWDQIRRRRPRRLPGRLRGGPDRPGPERVALKRLTGVLAALRKNNQSVRWGYFERTPGRHRRPVQPAQPRPLGRRRLGRPFPRQRRGERPGRSSGGDTSRKSRPAPGPASA